MLKSFFHTGFVVEDLERLVAFYSDVLGMRVASQIEIEGEVINQILGFPDAHVKGAFLNQQEGHLTEEGYLKEEGHLLELIQYITPPSGRSDIKINDLGASHLAFYVDDLDRFYQDTSRRGLTYVNPPASLNDSAGNLDRKVAYSQDPDGNWLEFIEVC